MSRIDELKKQYKEFALSDLDIMKMIVPNQASKYVEVLAKLTKNHIETSYEERSTPLRLRSDLLQTLVNNYDLDYNYLETLETSMLLALYLRIDAMIGSNRSKLFAKFANLNDRGLIANNDVTSYKTFDEIESAVSLAEIKLIDKELEKQIIKIHEDDEWLLLKPLSLEASMKYGANTKWCTTMDSGKYFANYSKWGILIYALNKKTGYKFASFKNLDSNRDKEFSFWNPTDHKIDPLDTLEIPTEILSIIRKEVNAHSVPNTYYMDMAVVEKLNQYTEDNTLRFTTSTSIGNSFTYNTANSIYTTGTVGIGNTEPTAQLAINGDLEVRDGSIRMVDNSGIERARLTSEGIEFPVASRSHSFEQQQENISEIRSGLQEIMDEMLNEANERVVEERAQQQTLLGNLELGTLDEKYIKRMQQLAGIDTNKVMVEVIRSINDLTAETESLQAELTGVPSKPNLINKIKSGYEKAKVHIRRFTMGKGTKQPI